MWARSQPWKIPRVGLCVRHTTDQECRYVFLCRYCFRRRPGMRSCAKGAPGGPEKKGPSPPRRRRPPDSDVEGATLLRLACERGGVDCRLLRRLLRLAYERALLAELLEAQPRPRLAAGVAADAVRSAALVLDHAAARVVELEQGGADVPLGRLVIFLRIGARERIASRGIVLLADLLQEELLRLPLLVVREHRGELRRRLVVGLLDGPV